MIKNTNDKIVVMIDENLLTLVPNYLAHRQQDVNTIETALAQDNYESIQMIGHRMRGSGGGYGFNTISEIGEVLEEAAKGKNQEAIRQSLHQLIDYLNRVEVLSA